MPRYNEWVEVVNAKSEARGMERFALLILALHANPKGEASPGIRTLAEWLNCSQPMAANYLGQLVKRGELTVGANRVEHGAKVYRLLPTLTNRQLEDEAWRDEEPTTGKPITKPAEWDTLPDELPDDTPIPWPITAGWEDVMNVNGDNCPPLVQRAYDALGWERFKPIGTWCRNHQEPEDRITFYEDGTYHRA